MRPRAATEIAYALRKNDPWVIHGEDADKANQPDAHHYKGVQKYLDDLEAEGLVVNLGPFDDPKKALAAQDKHSEAINFEGDRQVFASSANGELGFPFLDRADHYVFTKACHARLTGATPTESDTPPGGATDERHRDLFGDDR
jgi:hypothetical protein